MIVVKVMGCSSPQRTEQVREVIGARHLRTVPGGESDRDSWFVDFTRREEADLAVVNLRLLHGIRAHIEGDLT